MTPLPLVLLHGWGVRPSVWDGLRAALPEQPILTPALQSAPSLDAWAEQLHASLPQPCVLGGWSLGAMLAICLAQRQPRSVAGLLLIAPTPRFVAGHDWRHGLDSATVQAFREAFQRDPARTQQRFLALQALGDADRHAVTQGLQACLADPVADFASLAQGLRLLADEDLRRRLPPTSLPGLIIHGEQDALVPILAGRALAEPWSASRVLSLPDTGHAPFLSQGARVSEAIRAFMAQCQAKVGT